MLSVLSVVLPIFALILAGYLCRRTGRLGETAASELNRFVIWLCLPALLFRATALASWEEFWHPDFIMVTSLSMLAVFAVTLLYRLRSPRHLADASIDGLSAAYANTGYIGIPLCLLVLGDDGLRPALIATLLVVCVLFAVAVIFIEVGLQVEKSLHHAAMKVLVALGKNPLVLSPLLGACWAGTGVDLPEPVDKFLFLLGEATTPCALVSLGLFLAQKQQGPKEGAMGLVAIKLFVHPLITWLLAYYVFRLPPLWAHAALLLSALPTGTGPFMLAEFYRREASVVSRTILLSTIGSLITVSLCLYWIKA
ncbi:AEC family transporter [Telmatospirillum sp. J64-1]|uniref:AEC family transporter n=1 Tax=Telmatospirillum sp. J64-1 TaxID=2502183 RepID=UPI00115E7E65|nr:AEC family transporter [Telmatospirillum sp. J64-1]